jgi:hypothetical protein
LAVTLGRILSPMRFLLLLCFLFASFGFATQEVVAPRVRVLYDDPSLAVYAQQVAFEAEAALDILSTYFGEPERPIVITVNNNSDVFNAFGSPLPRPKVSVRALFPNDGLLGFGAESEVFLLLIHELTHTTQLSYTEGSALPRVGVVGEATAQVPPMWFLEGIAVWVESEHTEGGRRDDGLTKGLLETLAVSEDFPTLPDISVITFEEWPGGNARYLLGVSFLQHLIDARGIEAILATLREYNAGFILGDFAGAWQRATGGDLFAEWDTWRETLKSEAEKNLADLPEERVLTNTNWYTSSPALSSNGTRLAWVSSGNIVVADVADGKLENQQTVIERRSPDTLEWLDDKVLLYSRIVRRPGTEYLELFSLDVTTSQERRLTEGARAQFPKAMPDGCILFLRDLPPEGSMLRTFCDGTISTFWKAPENTHIVGLDVSERGQILISLWRGGQTDIALLENKQLIFQTDDRFQDSQASFASEDEIIFTSNRDGKYQLYSLHLAETPQPLAKLTASPGAALQGVSKGREIFYVTLGAKGYNVAVTQERAESVLLYQPSTVTEPLEQRRPTFSDESEGDVPEIQIEGAQLSQEQPTFAVRRYSPWSSLLPYGWLPTKFNASLSPFYFSLGASLYGLDDTLQHSYSLNASYNTYLRGHLAGLELYGVYEHHANTVYTQLLPPYPAGFGVRFGVWEHSPHLGSTVETALGFETTFRITLPLDRWVFRATLQGGLVHLQSYGKLQPDFAFGVSLSQQFGDDWGYRTRGPRYALSAVASASPEGASLGAWTDASYYQPLSIFDISGTLELTLRAGYRPSLPIPVSLSEWAAVGTLGYRVSLPLEWRLGDGRYALERLTLEPRVRSYFDGVFGLGADITVSADTILGYGAPSTFAVAFGYAQNRLWSSVGLRLPL